MKIFKKKSKKFSKKIFSSNTCLVILEALSVVKISARSAEPSSRSRNGQKRGGGVPLRVIIVYVLSEFVDFEPYPRRSNHPAKIWEYQITSEYVRSDRIYLSDLIGSNDTCFIGICGNRLSGLQLVR